MGGSEASEVDVDTVHVFGQAREMKPLMKLADQYNLVVIQIASPMLGGQR